MIEICAVADPKIDIVLIGAHPYMHRIVTEAALEAGKHVFTQARMAHNWDDAQAMYAAAQRHPNQTTMISPPPHFMPGDRVVRRMIKEGFIGEPRNIVVQSYNGAYLDPNSPLHWRQRWDISGVNVLGLKENGVDVAMNQAAFTWGRRAAVEPDTVTAMADDRAGKARVPEALTVDDLVARRTRFLTEYQDAAYARRYTRMVALVREAEGRVAPGRADLAEAVVRNLFKLMAVKDEYEVARLYTDGRFADYRADTFKGGKAKVWLAPPIIAPKDANGRPKKIAFDGWMLDAAFPVLAKLKGLRGTPLDLFGHTDERKMERGPEPLLLAY